MKLSVLTENVASGYFTAEFGLSYYIEHDDKTILFDTGHSNNYLRNAERLNIDISKVEIVVLSHGHWDHGNGLKFIKDKKLICHPNVFMKRYRRTDNFHIGLDLSYKKLNRRFKIITSKEPYHISENIIFLGEIPRLNSFEFRDLQYC
jgi:7,8-dihydropterin-6-yl-methyl-4-(beta-D-ribofuranosyl)aminobenzene 5'-phosphate synthase